jgi:hypothetical protein
MWLYLHPRSIALEASTLANTTGNAMANIKRQKDKIIYKTLHRKLKIEQHEPHSKLRGFRCSGMVRQSCSSQIGIHYALLTLFFQYISLIYVNFRYTDSDYPFDILDIRILITPLVS